MGGRRAELEEAGSVDFEAPVLPLDELAKVSLVDLGDLCIWTGLLGLSLARLLNFLKDTGDMGIFFTEFWIGSKKHSKLPKVETEH